MHELGIATNILETVRIEMARRDGARAVKVELRVGELSAVDRDSLRFCFEALVKGSDLEPLDLSIDWRPHAHRCQACETVFEVVDYHLVCPHCSSTETTFAGGDELEIAYLEIEEP
jgi:hydrogenase nickel incorporation protein HypA/HybF